MMTPYEVVNAYIHERMISVKLAVQLAEKAIEEGNFEEAFKWTENIRANLEFSRFERNIFVAVQAANKCVNRTQEGAAS